MQSYQDVLWQVNTETEQAIFRVPDAWKAEYQDTKPQPPYLDFLPWPIRVTSLMFADGTQMSTAGGGGGGSQTPWLSNIDADGFSITNLYSINGVPVSDIIAGGGSQTPWLSNIDAAGFQLNNLSSISSLPGAGLNINASALTNFAPFFNYGEITCYSDVQGNGYFGIGGQASATSRAIIYAAASQDGLAISGTPTYAQIRLVPTYGFGTAVLIQNDGTNLTIRGAPSSNYFGPGTTTQLTIALPNGNAFFAGSIQATDFLVGGVSIVDRIAALEAAI